MEHGTNYMAGTCHMTSCPISNSMVFTNAVKIQIGEISISIFLICFPADAGGFLCVVHLNSLKSDYLACPCLNILQTRHTYERMRAAERCSTIGSIFERCPMIHLFMRCNPNPIPHMSKSRSIMIHPFVQHLRVKHLIFL